MPSPTTSATDVRPPVPTWAAKRAIQEFAERMADKLDLRPGELLDPVVVRLGGRIDEGEDLLPSSDPPSIVVRGLRDFTITVPSTTSMRRNRFTIAHELGHLFLHYPLVTRDAPAATMRATRWVDPADGDQQRAEWEANWFASAFLMPSEAFAAKWVESGQSVEAVAQAFYVSEQAARYRVDGLHLA